MGEAISIIKKNKLFYFGVMFIGLLTSILYSNLQKLTGDQTQMLYKGYLGAYEGGLAQLWQCGECGG